jgi:hypothetical protein
LTTKISMPRLRPSTSRKLSRLVPNFCILCFCVGRDIPYIINAQ